MYRILDDLYDRTCLREPATLNERAFVQVFGEKLQSVFEQSRANRKSPEKSWAPFKHVCALICICCRSFMVIGSDVGNSSPKKFSSRRSFVTDVGNISRSERGEIRFLIACVVKSSA